MNWTKPEPTQSWGIFVNPWAATKVFQVSLWFYNTGHRLLRFSLWATFIIFLFHHSCALSLSLSQVNLCKVFFLCCQPTNKQTDDVITWNVNSHEWKKDKKSINSQVFWLYSFFLHTFKRCWLCFDFLYRMIRVWIIKILVGVPRGLKNLCPKVLGLNLFRREIFSGKKVPLS